MANEDVANPLCQMLGKFVAEINSVVVVVFNVGDIYLASSGTVCVQCGNNFKVMEHEV